MRLDDNPFRNFRVSAQKGNSRLAKTLIYQEVMTETMVKDLIRPQRADGGVGGALGTVCAL